MTTATTDATAAPGKQGPDGATTTEAPSARDVRKLTPAAYASARADLIRQSEQVRRAAADAAELRRIEARFKGTK